MPVKVDSKPKMTIEVKTRTTKRITMTEAQVADACKTWLALQTNMVMVNAEVEFDCSMGGMFREAVVTVTDTKETQEHVLP